MVSLYTEIVEERTFYSPIKNESNEICKYEKHIVFENKFRCACGSVIQRSEKNFENKQFIKKHEKTGHHLRFMDTKEGDNFIYTVSYKNGKLLHGKAIEFANHKILTK
jgi:hypothetical protein